ncbi:maleylpyruvate isomerase N-terminal domain-containing protein [Saccharopolyspora flava]|uniref:Mycothiol maleylpyruvate isomerase N-terminal domain-containing protein n=1 Tax=Saccharopolyspora flava TaxID=95161 RepID=A0A1I6Q2A9_9PSEU|nr:Mycothiol maleylpyruvate isomerase N-terminal domain-containing protein [Saccharopolyspora flava]
MVRDAYLRAAGIAVGLIREPAVAEAWERESALAEFRVSGLVGHLGAQVLRLPGLLAAGEPAGEPISLLDYYSGMPWVGADVHAEINVKLRELGEEVAAEGHAALVRRLDAAIEELRTTLPAAAPDRLVEHAGRAIRLDDYLVTRMMEIAVHDDDIAVSVGVETPELPSDVIEPVLRLLSGVAARRHGQSALLRALARAERAPSTINAL